MDLAKLPSLCVFFCVIQSIYSLQEDINNEHYTKEVLSNDLNMFPPPKNNIELQPEEDEEFSKEVNQSPINIPESVENGKMTNGDIKVKKIKDSYTSDINKQEKNPLIASQIIIRKKRTFHKKCGACGGGKFGILFPVVIPVPVKTVAYQPQGCNSCNYQRPPPQQNQCNNCYKPAPQQPICQTCYQPPPQPCNSCNGYGNSGGSYSQASASASSSSWG